MQRSSTHKETKVNSLNSAAAQAHIDDLVRSADSARRARHARNRRFGSILHLLKP
jgi:hypothetical protein